jgi:hypothetical protein
VEQPRFIVGKGDIGVVNHSGVKCVTFMGRSFFVPVLVSVIYYLEVCIWCLFRGGTSLQSCVVCVATCCATCSLESDVSCILVG